MIETGSAPQQSSALRRLALFVCVALAGLTLYYFIMFRLFLFAPNISQSMARIVYTALPVASCFGISIPFGLWRKDSGILIRFVTSVSCVALPLAAAFAAMTILCWGKCDFGVI